MSQPSISQGQIAIDPANGVLYYKAGNSIINSSLGWSQVTSTLVSTGDSVNVSGNLTVTGNLVVTGSTTSVQTETITLDDNIIVLNNNENGVPSQNAGIEVERGTSTNVALRWNESAGKWQFTNDGTNYTNINENVSSANSWSTARTITLSGDVTGSVSIDGTQDVTLGITVANDSHNHTASTLTFELSDATDVTTSNPANGSFLKYVGNQWTNSTIFIGADTVGNYVESLTAGAGITLTNATAAEGGTPTIAVTANTFDAHGAAAAAQSAAITHANTRSDTAYSNAVIYVDSRVINDLSDVNTSEVSDGQFLKYLSSSNQWVGAAVPTINNLDDVGDVTITAAASGQFLKWSETTYEWVNGPIFLGADTNGNYMSDVSAGTGVTVLHTAGEGSTATISIGQNVATDASPTFAGLTATTLVVNSKEIDTNGALSGQVLKYNGIKFVPSADNVAEAGQLSLADLADISISSASANQFLGYNTSTNKWNSKDITFQNLANTNISNNPANKNVIHYNGTQWINRTPQIVDCSDVVITDPENDQILVYNSTSRNMG